MYLAASAWVLADPAHLDDRRVLGVCAAFAVACAFDVGLFVSTRPADVLRFLVMTAATGGAAANWVMIAFLYVNSGLAKLRGFFWGFTFHYQFLLPSATLCHFRRAYLRKDLRPSSLAALFGYVEVLGEAVVGLLMLVPVDGLPAPAVLIACSMHAYICVCGIGPHRWNHVHCYLLLCSYAALPPGDGAAYAAVPLAAWPVVLASCLGVPLVGYFNPDALGKFLGGFRMATFHFVGNEAVHGFFVRRTVLERLHPVRDGRWHRVLAERAAESTSLSGDPAFLQMIFYADGMDFGPVLDAAASVAGLPAHEFSEQYVWLSLLSLNSSWAMLNTKWDESIACITRRFVRGLVDGLGPLAEGPHHVRDPSGSVHRGAEELDLKPEWLEPRVRLSVALAALGVGVAALAVVGVRG